ncbi:MAG: sterol desaturase family protein [Gemmataceae bacterium]
METALLAATGFVGGVVVGSLAEYGIHILMHRRIFLGRTHRNHHREPEGENWLKQFVYYVAGAMLPSAAVCSACWPLDLLPLGLGTTGGGIAWAAWVAYAHTLQHERPELVFWMKLPVHHLHHEYEMARHNFGLSVDWWDRVFGTYKPMPWQPPPVRFSVWPLARIRWF